MSATAEDMTVRVTCLEARAFHEPLLLVWFTTSNIRNKVKAAPHDSRKPLLLHHQLDQTQTASSGFWHIAWEFILAKMISGLILCNAFMSKYSNALHTVEIAESVQLGHASQPYTGTIGTAQGQLTSCWALCSTELNTIAINCVVAYTVHQQHTAGVERAHINPGAVQEHLNSQVSLGLDSRAFQHFALHCSGSCFARNPVRCSAA